MEEAQKTQKLAKRLLREGVAYHGEREFGAALGAFSEARGHYERLNVPRYESKALRGVVLCHYALGNYSEVVEWAEVWLGLARRHEDFSSQEQALNHLGNAWRHLHDYRQSIKYQEESLRIAEKLGNEGSQVAVLNNLGLAYKNLGDFQQAIAAQEKGVSLVRAMKVSEAEQQVL